MCGRKLGMIVVKKLNKELMNKIKIKREDKD